MKEIAALEAELTSKRDELRAAEAEWEMDLRDRKAHNAVMEDVDEWFFKKKGEVRAGGGGSARARAPKGSTG